MSLFKKKRPSSILSLSLDGNRLVAAQVRRNNDTMTVVRGASAPLALSVLTGDPELVGQEIRNHLNAADIREKRCAVALPLGWLLTLHTKIPDLPEEEIEEFLQIEAERGFPSSSDSLYIKHSIAEAPDGEKFATVMAVPRNHLSQLEAVLRAAQLKPLTFSIGIACLQPADKAIPGGILALACETEHLELEITAGGGIVALRTMDNAIEMEGGHKKLDVDLLARELRITFGQVPTPFSDKVRKLKICGRSELAKQLIDGIAPHAQAMGLTVELLDRAAPRVEFTAPPPSEVSHSAALAVAATYLRETDAYLDFLPPKVSQFKQFIVTKLGTRKLAWVGAGAGLVLLCVGGVFGFQAWQLSGLNAKWAKMADHYNRMDNDQKQIKKYRPWFDTTYHTLRTLRGVTVGFPTTVPVFAKSLVVNDVDKVTVTGNATKIKDVTDLELALAGVPGISNVKVETIKVITGQQATVQFTLSFQWGGVING